MTDILTSPAPAPASISNHTAHAGLPITWSGSDVNEIATVTGTDRVVIRIDPRYYRPTEVDLLLGDPTKAKKQLKWEPKIKFAELVREMVDADILLLANKQEHM